ncbi:hypothetical protein V866_006992 [Kwoniella sp. B9012]
MSSEGPVATYLLRGTHPKGLTDHTQYNEEVSKILAISLEQSMDDHSCGGVFDGIWDKSTVIEGCRQGVGRLYGQFPYNRSLFLEDKDSLKHVRRFATTTRDPNCVNGLIVISKEEFGLSSSRWSEYEPTPWKSFKPDFMRMYVPADGTNIYDATGYPIDGIESEDVRRLTLTQIYNDVWKKATSDGELPSSNVIKGTLEAYKGRRYGLVCVNNETLRELEVLEDPR